MFSAHAQTMNGHIVAMRKEAIDFNFKAGNKIVDLNWKP